MQYIQPSTQEYFWMFSLPEVEYNTHSVFCVSKCEYVISE